MWPSDTEASSDADQSDDTTALSSTLPTVDAPSRGSKPTPTPKPTPTKAAEPTTFPDTGPNTFQTAQPVDVAGAGQGTQRTYTVELEDGLKHDKNVVAKQVASVLGDERGWRSEGWSFKQVESGGDFRILLASPGTVDRNCYPLLTYGEVSCRSGNRVVLNVKRWTKGVEFYGDDIANYRRYLVNHEVGHALGKGHVYCPGSGQEAPVMQQQTKGLQGCVANPWP